MKDSKEMPATKPLPTDDLGNPVSRSMSRRMAIMKGLPTPSPKFKVLVEVFGEEGKWHGNGMVFETEEAAHDWGVGLLGRWTLAKDFKVEEVFA